MTVGGVSSFVYHRKPENLRGSELMPLNDLRDHHPEEYRQHVKKYDGRNELMNMKIPLLDCLWNDVLHCSPVHPMKIMKALVGAGLSPSRPSTWFKIPSESLSGRESVVYFSSAGKRPFEIEDTQVRLFDPSRYNEMNDMPEETKQYYRETAERGGRPLLFAGCPHILIKGSLSITSLDVVSIDPTTM